MHSDHWFNCSHPHLVKNRYTGDLVQVPCGKCPSCKVRRMSWYIPALKKEALCHKYVDFFTLTYSDNYLPTINLKTYKPDKKYEKSFNYYVSKSEEYLSFLDFNLPILKTSDVQKFIKRLRINSTRFLGHPVSIRYFISGDIGGTTFRPHYHGLLFYDNDQLRDNIQELFSKSWSVRSKNNERELIGYFQVEPAYSAATYCSSYVNATTDRPDIYYFRDFAPKAIHSSSPSLGSLLHPEESIDEIVRNGLVEVSFYDPDTFRFRKSALSSSMLYRLFPRIPSFSRLSQGERFEIYRSLIPCLFRSKTYRRIRLYNLMSCNSFFNDYICYGTRCLPYDYLDAKLDRLFYSFKRLFVQSSSLGYSIYEYDDLICQYYDNVRKKQFNFQFDYENRFMLKYDDCDRLNCVIDMAYSKNLRKLPTFVLNDYETVDPHVIDGSYFVYSRNKLNSMIKSKLDRAYLEKHPEFKQFHSF